jgi:hypothetical protein
MSLLFNGNTGEKMSWDDSDIGFGKPPRHSRFRKGISGNPKGRPPGKRNFATILHQIMYEKTSIEDNGVRRTVTKIEAVLIRLANQATTGDPVASRLFTTLARSFDGDAPQLGTKEDLNEGDLKIILRALQRHNADQEGEKK